MGVIILKAKTKLLHEKYMEMGENTLKEENWKWVYRNTAINADDIYRVTEYNSAKCVIRDIWDNTLLIDEPFSSVVEKWSRNKTEDLDLSTDVEESDDYEEEE